MKTKKKKNPKQLRSAITALRTAIIYADLALEGSEHQPEQLRVAKEKAREAHRILETL
jgi:hypothetical protein